MKVILFGATGMVGQGALRECLRDPEVESVLVIGRRPTGEKHDKVKEIVVADPADLSPIESQVSGYDACFFCLGVSSVGLAEAEYRRITRDLTLSVARTLLARNPALTFVFVSGAGTDSSERGSSMWARVKGETENALLKMPFKGAYMLRPGFILPRHGISSRTRLYRVIYAIVGPLFPVLSRLFPDQMTTTERLGRSMLAVAKHGAPMTILDTRALNALAPERVTQP